MKDSKNRSKFLSLILRHKPETIGIRLDKKGWAFVNDLAAGDFTLEELEGIVRNDSKGRYEMSPDKKKIRAVQGHSINGLEVEVERATPPGVLYHGSKEEFMTQIFKHGLSKMNRQFVHLSADEKTAREVADRRNGKSVIFVVDCVQMVAKDYKFYRAKNGVWLTDNVPTEFLDIKK